MLLAPASGAFAQTAVSVNSVRAEVAADQGPGVIANAGPLRLVFDRVDLTFNNRIAPPATSNLGFAWRYSGDAACGDGLDNDDHIALGNGRQDGLIDFPDDPECASREDVSEDKAGLQERRPVMFAGELDGEGRLLIPRSGIDIPTVWAWSSKAAAGGDQVYIYDFEPIGDAIGLLNPFTRELGLNLAFRIRVSLNESGRFTGPGDDCYVGTVAEPIVIRLTTIEAHSEAGLPSARGAAYAADTGAIKLVGYNVGDVGGAAECGAFGALNEVIGAAFGVPSAPGNIRMSALGLIEPLPVAAQGATPNTVRVPRELFPRTQPVERKLRISEGVALDPPVGDAGATPGEVAAPAAEAPVEETPIAEVPAIPVADEAAAAEPGAGAETEGSLVPPSEELAVPLGSAVPPPAAIAEPGLVPQPSVETPEAMELPVAEIPLAPVDEVVSPGAAIADEAAARAAAGLQEEGRVLTETLSPELPASEINSVAPSLVPAPVPMIDDVAVPEEPPPPTPSGEKRIFHSGHSGPQDRARESAGEDFISRGGLDELVEDEAPAEFGDSGPPIMPEESVDLGEPVQPSPSDTAEEAPPAMP